jgi:probable HAF family extracellular repeat protein
MMRRHLISLLLCAAGTLYSDPAARGGPCYDPEGRCASQPCQAELACDIDADCPPGYQCGPSMSVPDYCICQYSEYYGNWRWNCSLGIVAVCVPIPQPTGPRGYTLIDLGTLGGWESQAHGINNRGQVVGEAGALDGTRHAFLWEGGVMTDIGGALPPWNGAYAVNNHTQVIVNWGSGYSSGLWDNGVVTALGGVTAYAINDAGQIVGYPPSFLWQNGVMTYPTLGLGGFRDINSLGQIAGATGLAPSGTQAAVWDGQGVIKLGTLGGTYGYALALNDSMQVVGSSERAPGGDRELYAFLWQDGVMTDLSELAGASLGYFTVDINNCGEVLFDGRIYHPDYGFRFLGELIPAELRWYRVYGEGINDAGQIAGTGQPRREPDGWPAIGGAFLLDPVPGDLAPDGGVDLRDFRIFQNRFSGASPPASGCRRGDLDRDGDIDLADFRVFGGLLTGPR